MKCPMCDTSDFKKENGYYVCQICGHKIETEEASDKRDSSAGSSQKRIDKIISLVIFGFIALGIVIDILSNFKYYIYELSSLLFAILCLAPMIILIILTAREMKGKARISPMMKIFCLSSYVIGRILPIILNIIYGYFSFVSLIYAVVYIALVWIAIYKLEQWIKK